MIKNSKNDMNNVKLEKEKKMMLLINPLPNFASIFHYSIKDLRKFLNSEKENAESNGGNFELSPDFQRGHVWTLKQQIYFIENILRGLSPPLNFKFNCPNWNSIKDDINTIELNPYDFVCIDGLQRITAILDFLDNKFKVFNTYSVDDLKNTKFDFRKYHCEIAIYDFLSKSELLQFYIDLNSCGTPHSKDEIERVKKMLDKSYG